MSIQSPAATAQARFIDGTVEGWQRVYKSYQRIGSGGYMNELNFLDLVILKRIDANSSVESFGSTINTSFFETANILGTVKIKGYINIETSIGGISKVTITDAGTGILALAEKKSAEPIEPLDNALLHALAGGAKDPEALQSVLNIRSGDLAYHINKMVAQGLMDYDVRSGKAGLMLTEKGFNSMGGMKVQGVPGKSEKKVPEEKPEGKGEKKHGHEGKDDIMHILRGVEEEEKKHDAHRKQEEPEKPLSPEELKKKVQERRLASKIEHYVSEYWAWLLLIVAAIGIFAVAVYAMMAKLI
jgi:hypothetical protein